MVLTDEAPIVREARWLIRMSIRPAVRTMMRFAEDEIWLPPGGPYGGTRFRREYQPYVGLWFDEIDSGRWNRFAFSGCVQGGKTMAGWVIPACYHLFEIGEDVLLGLPNLKMAADKWERDLKPVIELTRYKDLIPTHGRGSRGGAFDRLQFGNGATLKFMGAGGGDAQRSGYTGRVIIATEVDKYDEIGASSEETSKLKQMLARSEAHAENCVHYLECTRSTTSGRIWKEYKSGTESRIVVQCRYCRKWVAPGPDDFKGWEEARDEFEAEEKASFCCPICRHRWTWMQRKRMSARAKLLHRGQRVDEHGRIRGPLPRTHTLGFVFSAFDNMFWPDMKLGRDELLTSREPNQEEAQRERLQFRWAIAVEPPRLEILDLDERRVQRRTAGFPRGIVPADVEYIGVGVDVGGNVGWYLVLGERVIRLKGGETVRSYHVIDYSNFEMYTKDEAIGFERGLLLGLREFGDRIGEGFAGDDGGRVGFGLGLVDSGWQADVVYQFCQDSGGRFYASKGKGQLGRDPGRYVAPRAVSNSVPYVGKGFHISLVEAKGLFLFRYDSDYWKRMIQAGLEDKGATTPGGRGAVAEKEMEAESVRFFEGSAMEHARLVKHLLSEREKEIWTPEHGAVRKFVQVYKQNHLLDCCVGARVAIEYQRAMKGVGDVETGDWFEKQRRG